MTSTVTNSVNILKQGAIFCGFGGFEKQAVAKKTTQRARPRTKVKRERETMKVR